MTEDLVNHPAHYAGGKIECIEAIEESTKNLTGIEAVCTANVIKYVWRWKAKGGKQDLQKAEWYLKKTHKPRRMIISIERIKSKFLTLHLWDFIKGISLAILVAALTKVGEMLGAPGAQITWDAIYPVVGVTFISYIIKNLLTNSDGLPGPERKPKPKTDELPGPRPSDPNSRV